MHKAARFQRTICKLGLITILLLSRSWLKSILTTLIKVPYKVIGPVAASVNLNESKVLDKLKEEAASMGADAIIFTKLNEFTSFSPFTGLSGVAIKFVTTK